MEAVVCEVNSAPGLSDKNTFKAYIVAVYNYIASLGIPTEIEKNGSPVVAPIGISNAAVLKAAPNHIE